MEYANIIIHLSTQLLKVILLVLSLDTYKYQCYRHFVLFCFYVSRRFSSLESILRATAAVSYSQTILTSQEIAEVSSKVATPFSGAVGVVGLEFSLLWVPRRLQFELARSILS